MDNEALKNGALYVRVSTDKQDELSPDAQIRLGLEYAAKHDITIKSEHIYTEHGISGKRADKRPAFLKMIGDAKSPAHPFDVILVWKFSRFARNQEESIVYKSLLKRQCRVEVISISEPLVEGPFGSLIERIIEWMDEYYSVRLAGEVKRGMDEKALRGGYQMTPCLGYQAVGKGEPHVIDEDEYLIYEYICDQFDFHHNSPADIARSLNSLGHRTKRNNLFEARTVRYILENPFYIGEIHWGGHIYPGSHEVRMPRERFLKRQEHLKKSKTKRRKRTPSNQSHWLSGIVKCPICGASLSFNTASGAAATPFFQCWKYSRGLHSGSVAITEERLVQSIVHHFDRLSEQLQLPQFILSAPAADTASEQELLVRQLDQLDSRLERLRLAYQSGVDTLDEYQQAKASLLETRQCVTSQLDRPDLGATEPDQLTAGMAVTISQFLLSPDISAALKNTFLNNILEQIVYLKQEDCLQFYFRSGAPS